MKEVLKKEGFVSSDRQQNHWFNKNIFAGFDKKNQRLIITMKYKQNKQTKQDKPAILYKGIVPKEYTDCQKLLKWLRIRKLNDNTKTQ